MTAEASSADAKDNAGGTYAIPSAALISAHIRDLSAPTYRRHALHHEERTWPETNCYVDMWIEVLHGLGLDPMPALAFTLALDFEGDQYTFFKFNHSEIADLYGIEVQELNMWKPVIEHAAEQVALGRMLLVEVDSYWLPDTAGVSYQIEHTKSSIGIQHIDVPRRHLGYFHGASYYELGGNDFDGVFRLIPGLTGPNVLPPFAEIAKLDRMQSVPMRDLIARAEALTRHYVARRPPRNPIALHRDRFARDLEWLRGSPNAGLFHQYAFATFRQLGSCFDVASSYLTWLQEGSGTPLTDAARECDAISKTAKTIQFKLARAVTLKREVDFDSLFDSMEKSWDLIMADLSARYGR